MKSPTAEQWRTGSAWALLGVSAIVLTGATAAFLIRPFAAAAMTVIPFWCWLGVGFALLALSWVFRPGGGGVHPRAVLAVVAGWLIAFSAFTEEPRSLVPGIWTPRPLPSRPG